MTDNGLREITLLLDPEQEDLAEEEEEAVIEKCPLYICVYICSFLSVTDGGNVRAVSRKWAAALQQLDLLNIYLDFSNAECINLYLTPMFDTMVSLANFPMQFDAIVDQCTSLVKETAEGTPGGPDTSKMAKQRDGLRNFVYENCKLFYKTNPTKWVYESGYWYPQSYCAKSDTANSDIDDDDNDFEEDDGFRYNYYGDDDDHTMRYNDKGAEEEDMGDVGYYSTYPDESAREIVRTRDELGYLNLHND